PAAEGKQLSRRGRRVGAAAAPLGGAFDGLEVGVFPPPARPPPAAGVGLSGGGRPPGAAAAAGLRQEPRAPRGGTGGLCDGRCAAAFLLGAALGGWLFGWLGDRVGRVRAMASSVMTYALFTGLCGLAQDGVQLMGLRFLAALGMGGEWALGVALVMECWPSS